MRFKLLICVAMGCGAVALPAQAAASTPVQGSWQQLVNCAFTHYDPVSGDFGCQGSSLWQGTWTGLTAYHAEGYYDVVSGNSHGTLQETFRGYDVDGRRGTLSFDESYVLDGATSAFHLDAHIVGGTGGFAGATGSVTFDGTDNLATGYGTYSGSWNPSPAQGSYPRRLRLRSTSR